MRRDFPRRAEYRQHRSAFHAGGRQMRNAPLVPLMSVCAAAAHSANVLEPGLERAHE
jgi:hypothetical protein